MPYKLKVKTDGKETIYERKEAPMLENLLDALKVQRQEIVMYSDPKKFPTDKDNERLLSLRAEFAANFWKNGLTKKDVLSGVTAIEGLTSIVNAINETLGSPLSEDDLEEKKDNEKPKK
ncbi:phage tail assembly chaperone G [Limosilactobacillus albertensis]|uniref:Glutamyl-tRNA synthetase n=1 Tax=Limosilactobacillus albertensis TaxID=2759752 RepID=A0A839HBZ1_9LACO|nr:glutamyl-tRNA synthetase [Limosilactobacillus albertensis]MBB1123562.1 glutamyl-tRNA synthetase [Limosilactobacillus albertensis]MCD7122667.1 glutamyl-tRNA synthetase [Limosilactobacillus albertensis]